MRWRLLAALVLLAGFVPAATFNAPAARAICDPKVTLTPPWGTPGTVVSVNLFHFPPDTAIDVILRVTGDPVVATGTTDAEGRANIVFTMPDFPQTGVNIFVTTAPCFSAGARFTFRTDVPTAPPITPATPVVQPTATAIPPTPQPPVAGDGSGGGFAGGDLGTNLALIALALVVFSSAFGILAGIRRLGGRGRDEQPYGPWPEPLGIEVEPALLPPTPQPAPRKTGPRRLLTTRGITSLVARISRRR
jgi:hypothetical protein